jgi:hypothetical protein
MEGVNSFEKGLHSTNSPHEQPEGSYVDALNWIRNDSGRLINEELEQWITDLPSHTLLGYTPLNDEFICFFQVGIYSEIGVFTKKNNTPNYMSAFQDSAHNYRLNFTKPIDCVARIVSTGDRVVYFVEENQPIRRFNLDTYSPSNTTYNTIEDFNLLLTYKVPYCQLKVNDAGGGLNSGVYSVVLRYRDEINNKTTFNIPTSFISITDDIAPSNAGLTFSDSIDGCAPDTPTTKSIDITLKHVDTNYKFIEIVIITYTGVANTLTIKSLGVYPNLEGSKVNFSSLLQLQDAVPTEEVTEIPKFYNSAKSIEQKDNILILSNLTSKSYNSAFQAVANNIELHWSIKTYSLNATKNINSLGKTDTVTTWRQTWDYRVHHNPSSILPDLIYELPRPLQPGSAVTTISDSAPVGQHNIYQDPSIPKGFTRGEVYSFSITPIYKDGSIGFSYHIPGKPVDNSKPNRLVSWSSQEKYPAYMNLGSNTTIKHHQMPDFDKTGRLGYRANSIYVLQVEALNIDFGNLKDSIQGYIIGYQQRNNDTNTRIIDYGFMRPYLKLTPVSSVNPPVPNRYRNSFFTGGAEFYSYRGSSIGAGKWTSEAAFNAGSPYAQYYSIDTLYLKKQITSNYYIQEIGKGINAVVNTYSSSVLASDIPLLITKSLTELSQSYIYLFFEEGDNTFYSNPPIRKIDNAQFVPSTVLAQPPTIIGDITVVQGSRFWHIEVTSPNKAFINTIDRDYKIDRYQGTADGNRMVVYDKPSIRLTRIVNPIPTQYGRIENAEYIPSVTVFDDQPLNITGNSKLLLEGDTYICKTFMRKWDLSISAADFASNSEGASSPWFDAHMLIGMYVETKNNLTLRYKEINGVDYYPKNRLIWGTTPPNTGIMRQPEAADTFPYNNQYSALNNIKVNITKPLFFTDVTDYPNRSIYSNKAFESEVVDQYRVFPVNQFHDIPKDRGVITDTFVFNNTFFHHTEYGLWQSFVNPNTTQTTSQGEIVLGNAGVFKIPSKLILDIKGGYMGTLDKSGTNTPFGRVFLDHHQGKVFLFTGEAPIEISDLGLFDFFREFVNTKSNYAMGYDWANKRLLITTEAQNTASIVYVSNGPNSDRHSTITTALNIGFLTSDKYYQSLATSGSSSIPTYYKFELSKKNKLKFLLESLNINYNLQILNSAGVVIKSSNSPDLFSDKITVTLDAGVYYILIRSQVTTTTVGKYNLYITLDNRYAISFYPKTQTWTSLHDFVPTSYLTLNGASFAWQDSDTSFYNLDNQAGKRKKSYITFVENTQPDAFKRFDRIEMNTMSGGVGGIFEPGSVLNTTNYQFKDQSFTNIHCWTDRQNSTELAFDYPTDFTTSFISNYDPSKVTVNYYRGSFHAELPLDAVIDPTKNIFDNRPFPTGNLDINANFRTHLKGKFLYTKLSYNSQDPLVLNYVKTFFKPTVA